MPNPLYLVTCSQCDTGDIGHFHSRDKADQWIRDHKQATGHLAGTKAV